MLLHGSTVATNAVLEHKFAGLGLIVTRGFRHMIEIARQSVPDGYGNSFFWVKPQRLVPLHLVREVPGRLRFDGSRDRADRRGGDARARSRELVEDGVRCIGVCLLHSYANGAHEQAVGELIAQALPRRLRLALLGRAARVPRIRAGDDDARRRAGQALLQDLSAKAPRDKIRARSGEHPLPDHAVERRRGAARDRRRAAGDHAPLRAGRRHPRLDPHGRARRLPRHPHHRRRRHLDRRRDHRELQADVHLGLDGRELSGEDADARHRHRRLGRRLDRLDRRLRQPQGRAAERRRRSRPDLLRQGRHASRPSPTRRSCSAACRRR